MGKVFHSDQLSVKLRGAATAVVLLAAFFLAASGVYAASGECDLFEKGYEYYLAYQPEKAAETFRNFIREYPESSAKDAAMFWLAKALIRSKSVDEAKKVLFELKREFSESPFIPYADKEAGNLGNPGAGLKTGEGEAHAERTKNERDGDPKAEEKASLLEEKLGKAVMEKERLEIQLGEEKKKAQEMRVRLSELERKEVQFGDLVARLDKQEKESSAEREKYRAELEAEKKRAGREICKAPQEKNPVGDEGKNAGEGSGGYRAVAVTIRDQKYTTAQILDFLVASSSVMAKAGIREFPWRSGNIYEDFINEEILYEEAKKRNVAVDTRTREELSRKLGLTGAEADSLARCLTVSTLIDDRIRSLPERRLVESLVVRFSEKDKQEKVALAAELQTQAKGGKSFEEIVVAFPGKVRFSVIDFQELQGWIKERIELLRDGEVSVVWTKDGYMILKPVVKKLSYRPFDEMGPLMKNEIRLFVKSWLEDLRKGRPEIKVVGPGKTPAQ